MGYRREAGWRRCWLMMTVLILSCFLIFSIYSYGQEAEDTDSDGMPDSWEETYGLNATDPSDAQEDPDGDGLVNLREYEFRIYPNDPDSDGDGMPDGWEVEFDLDPKVYSAENDADRDGFTDLEEYRNGTDPGDYHEPGDDDDTEPGDDEENDESGMASNSICLLGAIFLATGIIFFMILGLYSKIRKDKLLEHETRQKIMDFIRENPGTYYSQLRKELDLAHGVLTHHLNMLETQELIFSKQDRQFRRFYVDGLYKDGPMVTGTQKRVLDEIRRYPGSSQKEIADHLDLYPMMVSYHVSQLEVLCLVEKRKEGRKNQLYASSVKEKKDEDRILDRGPFEGPAPEMGIAEN